MLHKALVEDIEESLRAYPTLKLYLVTSAPTVKGRWAVVFNGEVFESYDIEIIFGKNYPQSLPKVYEVSNKISHEPDMHFNSPDWHACLFVSHERWEVWPLGSSFKRFLDIPVHNFFLGQAYFKAYGHWPGNRERGHGDDGIIEYYREKFKCKDNKIILSLLRETTERTIYRNKKCPCSRKKKLVDCHGPVVSELRTKQDYRLLKEAIDIFRNDCRKSQ